MQASSGPKLGGGRAFLDCWAFCSSESGVNLSSLK